MRENLFKRLNTQVPNIQNMETTYTTQPQKTKQPYQNQQNNLRNNYPKKTYGWLADTGKNAQHH